MKNYGLIGYPLSHSFSPDYFAEKFKNLGIDDASYKAFEISDIVSINELIQQHHLLGFNVTIPYKTDIISILDDIDPDAAEIGAVNCVKVLWNDHTFLLKGYNTDYNGFIESIRPLLHSGISKALIIGSGGSSKAVYFALKKEHIPSLILTRHSSSSNHLGYEQLKPEHIQESLLIINTTPLGMYPKIDACPEIPYEYITSAHIVIDLIYNPQETVFLKKAKEQGATVLNGIEMLSRQADISWEIWNKKK